MVCVYGGRGDLWAHFDASIATCTSVPDTLRLLRAGFADPARAHASDWARLDAAIAELPGTCDPIRIVRIGTAGAYADRLGAMEEPLLRTARGGRTGENNFPATQASFLWGSHAWFTGQWPKLREVVGNGPALCDEYHYPLRSWTGQFLLACVSAACGDFTTARTLADRMDQWGGSRRANAIRCYAAHAKTLIALSRGDFEAAYRHACRISPAGSLAPFTGHALWALLDTVEAAVEPATATGPLPTSRPRGKPGWTWCRRACASSCSLPRPWRRGTTRKPSWGSATRRPSRTASGGRSTVPVSGCTAANACAAAGRRPRPATTWPPPWRSSNNSAQTRGPPAPTRNSAPAAARCTPGRGRRNRP